MKDDRADFEQFYRAWPRKIARADAFRAWMQTAAIRPPVAEMIEAIARLMAWRHQLAARRDFVPALPYPATWLRGERWADEFDAPAVAQASGTAEAQAEWLRVREALARDDARTLTDHRTRHALAVIGWPALRNMRADQVMQMSRAFEQAFMTAPTVQRAQVMAFPQVNTRKVVNG